MGFFLLHNFCFNFKLQTRVCVHACLSVCLAGGRGTGRKEDSSGHQRLVPWTAHHSTSALCGARCSHLSLWRDRGNWHSKPCSPAPCRQTLPWLVTPLKGHSSLHICLPKSPPTSLMLSASVMKFAKSLSTKTGKSKHQTHPVKKISAILIPMILVLFVLM